MILLTVHHGTDLILERKGKAFFSEYNVQGKDSYCAAHCDIIFLSELKIEIRFYICCATMRLKRHWERDYLMIVLKMSS